MRKRFAIAGLLLLALAGTVVYLARPEPFVPGITWANAARIESGMTEAEVVAILGEPPEITLGGQEGPLPNADCPVDVHIRSGIQWSGEGCTVEVFFDAEGHAVHSQRSRNQTSWFYRLCWHLGL